MTDNEIINEGDICLYFYDNDNKSISVVEVVKKLSIDVVVVKFLQVFVDDSGNGFFDYLYGAGKTMNVSRKYLHKIDLIKRQQSEIEKHKNNCEKCGTKTRECIESLHNIIAEQQAEIKELNTIRSRLIYDSGTLTKISDELYQKIKAEAVKEFAEQLKETITNAIDTYYNSNGGGYYLAEDTIEDIDSLLKKW